MPFDKRLDLVIVVSPYPFTTLPAVIRLLQEDHPLVILSSVCDERVVMRAHRMGVRSYLALPVSIDHLIHKIKELTS